MTAKRAAIVGTCLGGGLICFLAVWALGTAPGRRSGDLLVTFAGWTNSASSRILAQFDVTNSFGRPVHFAVGELQFRGTNGWPPLWMLGSGTGDWLSIQAGSHLVISVPVPSREQPAWRVPLIYEVDSPPVVAFLDRVEGVDFGIVRWRRGRRMHRSSFVVGPEMVGFSNKTVQRIGAGGSAQVINRTASDASSGR